MWKWTKCHFLSEKVVGFFEKMKEIVENNTSNEMVKETEKLLSIVTRGNPAKAWEAEQKIVELRKKIDPILEEGNELVKYYSQSYSMKGLMKQVQ